MKQTTTKLPRSQIEISVEASDAELEPFLKRAAVLIAEENPPEGFRPGKAPYEIIKQKFGEYAIYERAAKLFIQKNYAEIIEGLLNENAAIGWPEAGLKPEGPALQGSRKPVAGEHLEPIGAPEISITKLAPDDNLEFKIKLSLLPQFDLPDYKKIAAKILKEKKPVGVEEKEIEDAINYLRDSRAALITVSRASQKGDRVEIDFDGYDSGVKLETFSSRHHPLVLGEQYLIPGFDENLLETKAGEEKEFRLKLADDFLRKDLAGKEIDFKVKMILVQDRKLPELNDEFAKGIGNFTGLENLRQSINEGIRMEKEKKEKDRLRIMMADEIGKNVKTEIPEILINSELEKMVAELKSGVESMGIKFDDYLLNIKKNEDDLKLDWVKDAERRVKIGLMLREIARQESIEPTEEEIQDEINHFAARSGLAEKDLKKIDKEDIFDYAKGAARNEKVFEFLEGLANRV